MAYPTLQAQNKGASLASNTTSHPITLPAHAAGDMLFVVFTAAGSSTHTAVQSGWTQVLSGGSTLRQSLYTKIAASSSEALTITTGSATQSSHTSNTIRPSSGNTISVEVDTAGTASGYGNNTYSGGFNPTAGNQQYLTFTTVGNTGNTVYPNISYGGGNLYTQAAAGSGGASTGTMNDSVTTSSISDASFDSNPSAVDWRSYQVVFWEVASSGTTHATTGALAGQGSTVSGSAARTRAHPSSGTLTGQGSSITGSAARNSTHASSGVLTGQGSSLAGSAARTREHPTSGVLTGQGSSVSGSAARTRAHASTGDLVGSGSVVDGASGRTRVHPTSGDLSGQGSVIAGSADRQGGANVHDTTGVLTGSGSTLSGSASRIPNHSTSGALVGQGSAVTGAATRFRAFSSSGTLTGQGSAIAGSAARVAGPVSHATTGVLVGSGSQINGSAARTGPAVTHDTSGELVGQGSSVNGQANLGEIMQDTHDGFWAKQWKRMRDREKRKELEEVREEILEIDEQIAEVQAAKPPKAVKKIAAIKSVEPQKNFYAEQAEVIEQLIAERQRLIEIEEEEMLLLL